MRLPVAVGIVLVLSATSLAVATASALVGGATGADRPLAVTLAAGASASAAVDFVLAAPLELSDTLAADIFQARCATCHTDEPGYAPTRATLGSSSRAGIVAALTTGSMQAMAAGLSREEIEAVASYLSAGSTGASLTAVSGPTGPQVTAEQAFCTDRDRPIDLAGGAWNGWAADAASSRLQANPGFRAEDVPNLRVKWSFALDGGIHSQPTVFGDRVYVSSIPGRVFSLDRDTGCVMWTYQTAPGEGGEWGGAGSRSTVVIGTIPAPGGGERHVAYLGDDLAQVHGVDARTGERLWTTKIDDHPFARVTGSAVFHAGRVYVPLSSLEEAAATNPGYECCTFRGSLVALDAATGAILWKTHTIDEAPRPQRRNAAGTQMHGPAGAPIWSTPTVDVEAGVIYAATGNSYTEVDQPGSNAIIAFDLESGAIHWKSQVREADNYVIGCPVGINCPEEPGPDYDFGSSPIIRNLPDGGRILLVGDKGAVAYGVDPDAEGKVLWETKVGAGSALGGIQWGSAADDEVFYVAVSDFIGRPNERRPGLNALRIADGELVWHTPAPPPSCSFAGPGCSNSLSAAISMVPGVIFSGSLDGYLRAFSSSDGSLLWGYDTARLYETVNGQLARGGSLDAGGPVIAGGMLFATSGYGRFGREPGNVLLAFSVGGR